MEEWIQDKINIELIEHDDTWIGEVISRGLKKSSNVKCFNHGKQDPLKRDCRQDIPRNSVFF